MIRKTFPFLCFFLLLFSLVNANHYLGFGIGYTAKNVYEDITGSKETEKGIPLLTANFGFAGKMSIVRLEANMETDFFGMDLITGNREITFFGKPEAAFHIPLQVDRFTFSACLGYGGIYRRRYIKEGSYLSVDKHYLSPANFEDCTIELLYGFTFSFSDFLRTSVMFTKDTGMFHNLKLLMRTARSDSHIPYISINYCGGKDVTTYALGLSFSK